MTRLCIACLGIVLAVQACTPRPVITDCTPLTTWSKAEQLQILTEEQKLSDGSILIDVLKDWARMRSAIRSAHE